MLDITEGKKAVAFARNVVEHYVKNDTIQSSDLKGIFEKKQGAFVTLHTHPNHSLRGCIGIPLPVMTLKNAIAVGIGLMITLVGLEWSGIIVDDPLLLVNLGDFSSATTQLALFGLVLTSALLVLVTITALCNLPFNCF